MNCELPFDEQDRDHRPVGEPSVAASVSVPPSKAAPPASSAPSGSRNTPPPHAAKDDSAPESRAAATRAASFTASQLEAERRRGHGPERELHPPVAPERDAAGPHREIDGDPPGQRQRAVDPGSGAE